MYLFENEMLHILCHNAWFFYFTSSHWNCPYKLKCMTILRRDLMYKKYYVIVLFITIISQLYFTNLLIYQCVPTFIVLAC